MKKFPFSTHARLAPKKLVADALFYLAGTVLYALAVNIFTAPNNVVPGGVTGVATLLNYLFGLPIGTLIFIINLPLFFLSWRFLGREFTVRTIIVTTVGAAIIDLLAPFVPPFRGDSMLVAVFGGVLAGAGLGLIYMRGATTGGSEIVARLLERLSSHTDRPADPCGGRRRGCGSGGGLSECRKRAVCDGDDFRVLERNGCAGLRQRLRQDAAGYDR